MENKLLKGCRHMKRGEGITKVDMDRFTVVLPTKPRKVYKCKTCGRPKKKCKKCPGKRVEPKERKEKVKNNDPYKRRTKIRSKHGDGISPGYYFI